MTKGTEKKVEEGLSKICNECQLQSAASEQYKMLIYSLC